MTDIASLQFALDSSQAVTSYDALTKLQERATTLADQQRRLSRDTDDAGQSFTRLRGHAVSTSSAISDLSGGFSQLHPQVERTIGMFAALAERVTAAQRALSSTPQSIDAYLKVTREAESMARVFGQSTEGLLGFINRTNELRLTAETTAGSLDRITRALENQTAAGAAARAVLAQYGVDVGKYQQNEPDKVLNDFVTRTRGFRDSPSKTRDIQAVLGPLSPDDLNTVMNPAYVPLSERQAAQKANETSLQISRTFSWISKERSQREREQAETTDLRNTFVDPEGATASESLAKLREWNALPTEERRGKMNVAAGEMADFKASPVGQWWGYINSGQYSSNEAAIQEQRQRAIYENSQPILLPRGLGGETLGQAYGAITAAPGFVRDQWRNFTGAYKAPEWMDTRPEDPYAASRRDLTLATQLAGYGETGFIGAAQSRQRALRMDQEGGRGAFRQAYGDDADRRYDNLAEINRMVGEYSINPEARLRDQTSRARFVDQQGPNERGFAGYVLAQAGAMGVPTSRMGNYADTQAFLGSDRFSPSIRNEITQGFEQQNEQRATGRREQLQDTIDLQNRLRDVMSQGTGAVQQVQVAWAAYNEELKRSNDPARAFEAAETAKAELFQKNLTLSKQRVDQMKEEIDAQTRLNDVADPSQSSAQRRADALTAGIAEQARAADLARPGTGEGQQVAEQERRRLGQQARADGNAMVAQATDQLRLESQLVGAMGERSSIMEKMRRDQQVDVQFQDAMAKAIASGDQARVTALERQVALVKEMKDAMAAVAAISASTQQLRVIGEQGQMAATTDRAIMALPADQRATARIELDADNVAAGRYNQRATLKQSAYQELPSDLRDAIETEIRDLPAATQFAIRGRYGQEIGGLRGDATKANPSQITSAAYQDVQADRERRGMPLGPSFEDLKKPENFRENVAAGVAFFEQKRAQGGGDPAYASAAYGPGGRSEGLENWRRTGDTRGLNAQQLDAMVIAGVPMTGVDMRRTFVRQDDTQRAADGAVAAYRARQDAELQEARESYSDRTSVRGQFLTLTRAGETGRAQMLQQDVAIASAQRRGDAPGLERAQQAKQDTQFGFRAEYEQQLGQADQEAERQRALGDAYGESSARVQEVTAAYQAMIAQKRLALSDTEKEVLQEKLLTAAREQTAAQAKQDTRSARREGDLAAADANMSVFAGPQTRGRERARVIAEQYIQDRKIEPQQANEYREATEYREVQRAIAEDQQQVRNGFLQMGQSAQSAFADAVLGGKNLQGVLAGLTQDWARLMLQMASRQAFNFLGDVVLKGANMLMGGGSFMPTTGQIPGASIPMLQAAGGAFDQGQHVAMLAAGDVVDRPTMFQLAKGKRALVGEAGRPEGVFPLIRTPGGELGVQVAPQGGTARPAPLPLTRLPNGDLAVKMPEAGQVAAMQANPHGPLPLRGARQVMMPGNGGGTEGMGMMPILMASGGVVEGGTVQPAPSAGSARMARESSDLPVARSMATGDIAMAPSRAGGGGGGAAVNVTNNITISGGAVGKGGVDPETQRQIQKQMERTARDAMKAVMADEMRVGGMLYGR